MIPRLPVLSPRLKVRPFSVRDAHDLYTYLSDERVYRFEPGAPIQRGQAPRVAAELAACADYWAVELQAECKVIGQLYFQQSEPQHLQSWELGYIIGPAYQRQGYAFEAVSALMQHAFTSVYIHRVVAHCSPLNPASWKLLEKLGFRREGLLRENIYFRRDDAGEPVWMDSYVYSLLESDPIVHRWCEELPDKTAARSTNLAKDGDAGKPECLCPTVGQSRVA